jgi:hypothetical protein
LASGGFEFDEWTKLQSLKAYPSHFLGSPANTGDGIRMATALGAQLWHMNCCSARLVIKFPDLPVAFNPVFGGSQWHSPWREAVVKPGNQGAGDSMGGGPDPACAGYMVVDRSGRRYTNEVFKPHSLYYELTGFDSQRLCYPRIPSFWIFDGRRIDDGPLVRTGSGAAGPAGPYRWSPDNRVELNRGWIAAGETVHDLARRIGADPAALDDSVRHYNRACREGRDADYGRPPATLAPLESPPYYAIPLWPGGPNTQGGPRRNGRSQVLRADGTAVPGLYSAGELGSVYGMLYPAGGGNLAECIAFGRIAGEQASGRPPA